MTDYFISYTHNLFKASSAGVKILDWILAYLVVFFFVWLFQRMITFYDLREMIEAD